MKRLGNSEVAEIFLEIADILEIKEENPFKIRAYRKAARAIQDLPEDLADLYQRNELRSIDGIGEAIEKKIGELFETGKLKYYKELKKEIPKGLVLLLSISEIGPKTAKLIYDKLKISTLKELEKAAKSHKLRNLFRMGAKTEENILRGIELYKRGKKRMLLGEAYPLAQSIIESLKELSPVKRISPAGSLRRMKETIRDIDILVTSNHPEQVMDVFTSLPQVREVFAHGETKSSVLMEGGFQVDIRVVAHSSFGAALQYFTGSKPHNIKLRELAIKRGLKINEYGVFKVKGERKIAGEDEEGVYGTLGLSLIPPELREDRGEIKLSQEKRLPGLLRGSQLKGDFHIHSNYSDGSHSIAELVKEAKRRGYKYIAICDHSKSLRVGRGLSEEKLLKQIKEIKKINKELRNFVVLPGIEVDIKGNGSLDYSDELLKRLDFVVAAIHSGFKGDAETITGRIVKAMRNRYVHAIAHPTGRLINTREPYQVNMEEVIREAAKTGTFLELNAFPERLDLNDIYLKRAKELGALIVIGTDAHSCHHLSWMEYGIATARRGWLEKKDVLNTLSTSALLKKLKR